jgi:hypothetical protein
MKLQPITPAHPVEGKMPDKLPDLVPHLQCWCGCEFDQHEKLTRNGSIRGACTACERCPDYDPKGESDDQ